MEALTEHLTEHYGTYIVAGAVVLPIIIIFRRWAIPFIQFIVEFIVYSSVMHVIIYAIVRLAAWFKDQSSMKRAFGPAGQTDHPGWETPLLEFWNREAYIPGWVLYLEVAFALAIFVLMWRLRPMTPQKVKKKPPPKKKPSGRYTFDRDKAAKYKKQK